MKSIKYLNIAFAVFFLTLVFVSGSDVTYDNPSLPGINKVIPSSTIVNNINNTNVTTYINNFDQVLNTTSNVTFNNITVGKIVTSYIEDTTSGLVTNAANIIATRVIKPLSDKSYDIGGAGSRYRDLFLSDNLTAYQIFLNSTGAGMNIYDNTLAIGNFFNLGRNSLERLNMHVDDSNLIMDYVQDYDENGAHKWINQFSGGQNFSFSTFNFRMSGVDEMILSQTLLDLKSNNINTTGNITGDSFIKIGGNSSQFLKADGSLDSSIYITNATWGNITGLINNQLDLMVYLNQINASWNQSLANQLYANISWNYNQTTPAIAYINSAISASNASWLSTYNATYATWLPNYTLYNKFWYNQSVNDTWTYDDSGFFITLYPTKPVDIVDIGASQLASGSISTGAITATSIDVDGVTYYTNPSTHDSIFVNPSVSAGSQSGPLAISMGLFSGFLSSLGATRSIWLGEYAGYFAPNASNSICIGSHSCYVDTVRNNFFTSNTTISIGRYSGTGGFSDSMSFGHGVINSNSSQGNFGNVLYLSNIYGSDIPSSTPTTKGSAGIGISPTARLTLPAGTTTVNTAPLKFTSGNLLATPEAGASEFLTDKFYGTITTGSARKEFTLNDITLTPGRLPFITTNGRLTDNSNLTYNSTNDFLSVGTINITNNIMVAGNTSLKMPYGHFQSTQTQTIASTTVAYPVTFNWTDDNYQILKASDNSNFTFQESGDYFIFIDLIATTNLNNKHISVWLQKNGINVARSTTFMEIPNSNVETKVPVKFDIDVNTTDVIRVMWNADDTGVSLIATGEQTNPTRPESPSAIMLINKASEVTV